MAILFNNFGSYSVRLTADAAAAPGQPTSVAQGDILFLVIEDGATDGTTGLPTVSGGTETWTQLPNSPQFSSGGTRLSIYWARASQAAPTMPNIGGGTNHTFACVARFTGGKTTGNPWNNSEYNQGSNAVADATVPGVTHSTANALAVVFVSSGFNGTNNARFSAWTNADLGSVTEIYDQVDTIGNGGGFGACTGTTSGTFGNTTVTEAFAGHAYISIVLAPAPPPTTFSQPHFRVRTGDTIGLNTDSGWYGALDANATIDAETVFRIRFEVEADATGSAKQFKLQYNRNSGGWSDVAVRTDFTTGIELVDIVPSSQYVNDDATTNLLSGSAATFSAGVGLEDNLTPSITLVSQHTEYEWALRIPVSYGETTVQHGRNADGDTFQFRIIESGGSAFGGTYVIPTITLNIPNYLIGGTYVESPKKIGPFKDGNGNLYQVLEYANTSSWFLLLKSADGGKSWTVPDSANSPTERDLESVDIQQVGTVLHIACSRGTRNWYQTFRTSDNATPDTWLVKDEVIMNPTATPSDQAISLTVRSDSTVVALYRGDTSGANERIYYKIRSSGGTWGAEVALDTEAKSFTDVTAILGASDKTHIFYVDVTTGILYHRSLTSADSLSARETVATGLGTTSTHEKPIIGAVYYDDAGAETIMVAYIKSTDLIYSSLVINDGAPGTEQQATSVAVAVHPTGTTSQQAVADISNDGTTVYLLYADASTFDIWRDSNVDAAGWGTDVEILDAVTADYIRGRIFTHSAGNGGAKVYGYTYDDGSGGTFGKIKYAEYTLSSTTTRTINSSISSLRTKTLTTSSSIDSLINKTLSINSSISSYIKKSILINSSIDSLIKKQLEISGSLDSLLNKTLSIPSSLDSLISKANFVSSSIDSVLNTRISITQSIDSLLNKTESIYSGIDVLVSKIYIVFENIDSLLSYRNILVNDTDSLLKKSVSSIHSVDSLIIKTQNNIVLVDTLIAKTANQNHSTDALLQKNISANHSVDILLKKGTSRFIILDSLINETALLVHSVESILNKTLIIVSSVDSRIIGASMAITGVDSLLKKSAITKSSSVDSRLAITEIVYDSAQSAHGGVSIRMAAAPNDYSYVEYSDFGTQNKIFTRQYIYLSGALSNITREFNVVKIDGASGGPYLTITTGGQFKLYSDAGSTASGSLPFGQWIRIEIEANSDTNEANAKIFYTKDSLSPDITINRTLSTSTTFNIVRFGISDINTTYEAPGYPTQLWIDDVGIDPATWLGPYGVIKHSIDSLVFATQTYNISHSVQSLLKITSTKNDSVDASIKKSITTNNSVTSLISKIASYVSTIDSLIIETQTVSALANSIIKLSSTKYSGVDSLLVRSEISTSSVDAIVKSIEIVSHNIDSLVTKINAKQSSIDAFIIKPQNTTSSIDALLSKGFATQAYIESMVSKTTINQHSIDSLINKLGTSVSHSFDSLLIKTLNINHGVDAYKATGGKITVGLDSLLKTTLSVSHNVSTDAAYRLTISSSIAANVKLVGLIDHAINSFILQKNNTSYSLQANIGSSATNNHSIDSLIRGTLYVSQDNDALIQKRQILSYFAYSLINKTIQQSIFTDSLLVKEQNLIGSVDVLIQKRTAKTHTIDSFIYQTRRITQQIDSLLKKKIEISSNVLSEIETTNTSYISIDSLVLKKSTVSSSIDVNIVRRIVLSSSLESLLQRVQRKTNSVDAYVLGGNTIISLVDSLISKRIFIQSSIDAFLIDTIDIKCSIGSLITKSQSLDSTLHSYINTRNQIYSSVDSTLVNYGSIENYIDALISRVFSVESSIDTNIVQLTGIRSAVETTLILRFVVTYSAQAVIKERKKVFGETGSGREILIPERGGRDSRISGESGSTGPEISF